MGGDDSHVGQARQRSQGWQSVSNLGKNPVGWETRKCKKPEAGRSVAYFRDREKKSHVTRAQDQVKQYQRGTEGEEEGRRAAPGGLWFKYQSPKKMAQWITVLRVLWWLAFVPELKEMQKAYTPPSLVAENLWAFSNLSFLSKYLNRMDCLQNN